MDTLQHLHAIPSANASKQFYLQASLKDFELASFHIQLLGEENENFMVVRAASQLARYATHAWEQACDDYGDRGRLLFEHKRMYMYSHYRDTIIYVPRNFLSYESARYALNRTCYAFGQFRWLANAGTSVQDRYAYRNALYWIIAGEYLSFHIPHDNM